LLESSQMKPGIDHPLTERVQVLLQEVAPILGMHGGSIILEGISEDNIVSLRFDGACVGCAAADYTLEYGLKEMILLQIEEVTDVIAVNTEPVTHAAPAPFGLPVPLP
jgi:Fe-S cluster biogenesis protein NfuA